MIVTSGEETDRFRAALRTYAEAHPAESTPDFPMPERYEGVYRERRRECGWQLYEAVGVERGDRAGSRVQTLKNFDLFGAPHAAIITTDADQGVYAAVDTGLYVLAFVLAAQSLGLGAIPQAALAHHGRFVHRALRDPGGSQCSSSGSRSATQTMLTPPTASGRDVRTSPTSFSGDRDSSASITFGRFWLMSQTLADDTVSLSGRVVLVIGAPAGSVPPRARAHAGRRASRPSPRVGQPGRRAHR